MIYRKKMVFVAVLMVSALCVIPAGAQGVSAAPPDTELALFTEIPTVYSASRMEESILEAPAAISVITGQDLENEGIIDLPDAFRRVPGMDVTAIDGGRWGVSARGYNEMWARRMLVLIDGMSVYTPLFSGVRWGILPLFIDDIDSIEVVRGPNDTLYGFNAFNGVINIKTKEAADTKGFFGKYIYGDYGKEQFIARYGDTIDLEGMGHVDYRMTYGYDDSQGYGDKNGREFSDKKELNMVTARTKYTMTDSFNAEFLFGLTNGLKNEGPATAGGATFKDFQTFDYELLKLNGKFSDTHSAYLQMYRWKMVQDAKTIVNNIDNNDIKETQYDIEFQDTFTLFEERSHTVWGGSYRHNVVEAMTVKANTDTNEKQPAMDDLWSVFLNEKFILLKDMPLVKSLTAVAGIRAEWSHLTRRTDFAPRASVLYEPVENNVFRATYARGYRLPSFVEEFDTNFVPAGVGNFARIMGNQALKPETVDSYELGYSSVFFDGKLELDADTYWAFYRDMVGANISQAGVPPPFGRPEIVEFNNEFKSQSWGLELAADAHPYKWMDLYANYTYETIKDGYHQPVDMQYQGGTPLNKMNVGLTLKFKEDSIENMPYLDGFSFNVNANYRSAYTFFNNTDSPRSEFNIKPHTRLDFRIAKAFFKDAVEVAFIGNNVAGGGNYEARWVKVPREYYMTVTLRGWPWDISFGGKDKEKK